MDSKSLPLNKEGTINLKKILLKVGRIILTLIIFGVFFTPFYWMVLTSIKTLGETLTFPPSFWVDNINFENFSKALQTGPFLQYTKNSLIVTFTTLILQFATVIPAAYAFARYKFKGSKLSFGLIMATMMIPAQLVFLPVFIMFSKWGIVNTYLSLILPFASSAFGIFMLRQRFMQVPQELLEAARLDDAGEFKIMHKIMIPMAKPTLVTLGLLTFISTWNDYFWPLVLTTKNAMRTLPVGVAGIANVDGGISYNILMAGNMVLIIPVLIIFFLAQKHIIKAFTYIGDK
ncbi:carbohydrate ABC transporter permease [Clostridium vincentii]|uniref:L-arabinose transport system permease protein AraQ n=1 Tax=Clostridium vincentii TaxID=52704 RepID=A0A2T0BIS5_9CLOT|nr:carbohydrate ABC transporter permease [Clostridium vincentii]PRR83798.1 L-arabinose transport system permease protein AraQ [Clostridium vincentii]